MHEFSETLSEHLYDIMTFGVGVPETLCPSDENTMIDFVLTTRYASRIGCLIRNGQLTSTGMRTKGRGIVRRGKGGIDSDIQ